MSASLPLTCFRSADVKRTIVCRAGAVDMDNAADFADLLKNRTERQRYETLRESLQEWRHLIVGKTVLDFGCSWGTSTAALVEMGAELVWGVEPDAERVLCGNEYLGRIGVWGKATLHHT